MKASKIFLTAVLLVSGWAQAKEKKIDDAIVVSVYSTSWCPSCVLIEKLLKKENLIPNEKVKGFHFGEHEIEINGKKRKLRIEKIDIEVVPAGFQKDYYEAKFNYIPAWVVTDLSTGKKLFRGESNDFFDQGDRSTKLMKQLIVSSVQALMMPPKSTSQGDQQKKAARKGKR